MNSQNTLTSQSAEAVTPDTLLYEDRSNEDRTKWKLRRRWYVAVRLKVADGFDERFQPTGFPNLGPALYKAMNDGAPTDYLLVESAQSLANWMEAICLDPQHPCRYNADCAGIPYVVVQGNVKGNDGKEGSEDLTSSLTEPHRLASDVILDAKDGKEKFSEILSQLLQVNKQRPVHLPRIARRLFYLDPACLLHGVFLEKLDGRIRFPRVLSATIAAKHAEPVNAGGVMRGYVTASGAEASIPYSTQHFSSPEISLQLTFHVDSLNGLGLDQEETRFLAAFALYKIRKLLESFPRLRTACVLDPDSASNYEPTFDDAVKAAFTKTRREAALKGVDVNMLPKACGKDAKGFEPFELLRA